MFHYFPSLGETKADARRGKSKACLPKAYALRAIQDCFEAADNSYWPSDIRVLTEDGKPLCHYRVERGDGEFQLMLTSPTSPYARH